MSPCSTLEQATIILELTMKTLLFQ